jgi:hypothetical protein
MYDAAEMLARHARVLAELTELGMAFARDARADAEAAQTPEERARQALVFQRVSRAIRQGLALEAKLAREAQRAGAEAAEREDRRNAQLVRARKNQLMSAVQGLVWSEVERLGEELDFEDAEEAEAEALVQLMALVDEESQADDFLTADLADQAARVANALGFEIAADGTVRRCGAATPKAGDGPNAPPGIASG